MVRSPRNAWWALIAAVCMAMTPAQAAAASGPFDKVWTVALSQFNQADETGQSLTQLTDGTLVVGGNDSNLQNVCSTHRSPLFGGAWLVAVTPSGGSSVWQALYSTCASSAQTTEVVRHTTDGGFILVGGDFDNPACGGCGWFAKLGSNGAIAWQHDLTGAYTAGADAIQPTPDGSFVAVGNESVDTFGILRGLLLKISSTGALQWSMSYSESPTSFPGAYAGGNFTFETVQPTADGGYIASGVANAKFSTGYATVLVVMKLDANGSVQWSNAYYGNTWLSGFAGGSQYPIFATPDEGYILSGTVQGAAYPFANLFFLAKLDARGNLLWQQGYGGISNGYHFSSESGGAYPTSDGGYVLAGGSDIFAHAYNGWMVKTDASGNILWQKTYNGLTSTGGNFFNDVIQTQDGGYAAAGDSWTANPTYGGPGLWLVRTDTLGNVGTCGCAQNTGVSPQSLDLAAYPATWAVAAAGLAFSPVNIRGKSTAVAPNTP